MGNLMEGRPVVFAFCDYEVDEALRELRRKGRRVELQSTPLRLLLYLLRNRDRVIPKDELLDRVWSDVAVSEGALSTAPACRRCSTTRRAPEGGTSTATPSRRCMPSSGRASWRASWVPTFT
jgi:hypothetical protein